MVQAGLALSLIAALAWGMQYAVLRRKLKAATAGSNPPDGETVR